ncbi:hypothetical protein [Actinopolymorpha pittospori]|uniref:Uncharacterized protein n=1 Tax=Actinopolymorpha pittospori TaxID=648752 RepID=A0A927N165_9ACTN|nr:hypothetical protein [Actinopolymorpha pittospori]MBE1609023.1 hypothetical protein [Actinopolymorpha pittospori]
MTAAAAGEPPAESARAVLRLVRLHLTSRRVPVALAAIVACAVALRVALHWQWNAYGALQLPLILETGCAAAVTVTAASPFGEPERATGRWLPLLRLGTALALTAVAAGVLAVAGIGADLAGGTLDVVRNLAGLTGIGLLCAALLGGALAWTAPTAYLMVAVYALYTQWHGPALTTPWIWPARPSHDLGAALCAGLVFLTGMAAVAVRGARDATTERL